MAPRIASCICHVIFANMPSVAASSSSPQTSICSPTVTSTSLCASSRHRPTKTLLSSYVRFINRHLAFIDFLHVLLHLVDVALSHPHVPNYASPRFCNISGRGRYGDSVTEMDYSVGRIMDAITANGFDNNTIVFFTSESVLHSVRLT